MTIKIRQDGLYEIIHPPGSILSYGFDWTKEITPESLVTSTWVIDPVLTLTSPSINGNITSVFVNGGTDGSIYYFTNTITTSTITTSRTIVLVCQPKGDC